MKKFRVIKYFTDLQDNNFAYHEGDLFPREGLEVSNKRIKELSTSANRRKQPLIEAVEDIPEEPSPKPEEVPQDVKAGESPLKKSKPKKSQKKA